MLVSLEERILAEIAADGPMPFERFVELALYDSDQGFYATSGRAGGHQGDFVTSVEVGPLFAAVVADWLDSVWRDAGEPAVFRVSEVGAGVGTLFRGINRAEPACLDSLVYTLVERSASMRVAHQALPTDVWRSESMLPDDRQHVVLANELLDNLAFGIAERTTSGWAPVLVDASAGALELRAGDSDDDSLAHLRKLAPQAPLGARVPVAVDAISWIEATTAKADRLLAFDYGASTAELGERQQLGWLRTYADHQRGNNPLAEPGRYDITHDVPLDQLPTPTRTRTQAEWLHNNGLPQRVELARAVWQERAHVGDLAAIAARSAIGEAEALTDPAGLGAFHVLEWS